MRKISVKIRGIYTTALTRLLLDNGYSIVQPSPQIQERFQIPEKKRPEDIFIRDREDHQGLLISGIEEHLDLLISLFRAQFLDMVTRRWAEARPEEWMGGRSLRNFSSLPKVKEEMEKEEMEVEVEFPCASKAALDSLRAGITPTVKNHHLLKIIASEWVELAERQLYRPPFRQKELEKGLREQVIIGPMKKKGFIGLTHVSPEGKVLSLRGGKIISLENNNLANLVIKRDFSEGHGRYDGLNLPIEEGDYGITEITENKWFLKHTYYSRQGLVKGMYWNINTPIEFYPDHIRYLDLHIDVIQKPGAPPKAIDQEKLEKIVAAGLISRELARKGYEIVHSLISHL